MRAVCLVILAGLLAGCGKAADKPAPVRGTVTLDTAPMPDGEVMLFPAGGPPTPFPVRDGRFAGELVPGAYRVSIFAFKTLPPRKRTDPPEADAGEAPDAPRRVNFLPARFNTECTLKVEVTAGGPNEFTFPTQSK